MALVSYEQELTRVLEAVKRSETSRAPNGQEEPTEELETDQEEPQLNEVPAPPIIARVTAKTLFSHPDAHPIVLDLSLLQKYGAEWLEWEPETVRYLTEKELGPMSDLNFSKVMACRTLHLVDSYWNSWEVFGWCTMPLNSTFPDFSVMQVPTVAELACSVDIANRIRDDMTWSDEVKKYMEVVCEHEGLFVPVPPLDFLKVNVGFAPVPVAEVSARWPDVRTTGKYPAGDTVVDEQLRRMLDVHHHLVESRARLRAQLPIIQHS